ncbi:helix-turn-helix domain-containing protein [Siminovitchia sp. 179-K 8D1 HS]|uniref:helix-turn-helix domain-containing protein n=1 Tax=Siminovitchia sp. 179-K 8D1 HS TaxID=3142385 RepID=UPI00399F5191
MREEKNITQAKLAEIINIRQESLSRIELGRINPSMATLEKISAALNIPLHKLFKGT